MHIKAKVKKKVNKRTNNETSVMVCETPHICARRPVCLFLNCNPLILLNVSVISNDYFVVNYN